MKTSVKAWAEEVTIPTYGTGEPNRNPMFLEKRVYQGSSGVVYPHAVIDRVADEKSDQVWQAVFLENAYIKLMILPELGGRLQRAVDKTNGYPFVYHNRVIKPALVGLTGPWISGGIEFNWPQHHRPSTYEPVNWAIEEHPDGSRTVWCSEVERMFRTRGTHGFTVYPGRAGFDVRVRLYNGTGVPQTFLWWANPAVHVNDEYQSVFPPDVHAVMDHGKRDVSEFPIATGVYYKHDYAPGTDISRYRNIPVPTSYMAYHSDYDFVGCYDHGARAGMLHVANHHLVPGKKQWTWGNGPFGRAWDRELTDEDGPYIELMCGAFTDNQPDFSWLMPGEEKRFTQTFMPYKEIGPAANASRDWVLSAAMADGRVAIGVYAAVAGEAVLELWRDPVEPGRFHNHKNLWLRAPSHGLSASAEKLHEEAISLAAAAAQRTNVALPAGVQPLELRVRLVSKDGKRVLLTYAPEPGEKLEIPSPAKAARAPEDLASNEELFLNGLHLEQYRHATWRPEPHYEEALRRDPGDSRCHNALGRLLLRRGCFEEAGIHFRAAIDRLTARNPNPYDGEPYYNLGLSLRCRARFDEAGDCFYKAVWSEAWKAPACFELARLAARAGRVGEALAFVEEALARNARHQKARHLRIALLRRAGRVEESRGLVARTLGADPLEPGALFEAERLAPVERPPVPASARPVQGYNDLELGLDYLHAGFWEEADTLFERAAPDHFMARYYLGWGAHLRGDEERAAACFREAAAQSLDYAFPNQVECVSALQAARAADGEDALAAYALGNFWYAHRRPDEAIVCWEQCTRVRPEFPTAWRNLGLAYFNQRRDPQRAGRALGRAFDADPRDARVLYELDQFHKETRGAPAERLARLDRHRERVLERDDLSVEYTHLLNLAGRPAEALEILTTRRFHPWEGGEGKTIAQYLRSLFLVAEDALAANRPEEALALLRRAERIPLNLGEDKLTGAADNELHYRRGRVLLGLGRVEEARAAFGAATGGISEPAGAMYYNDQPPESIYFQGLAWRALGREERAGAIFRKLTDYADRHIDDRVEMDYFAVSLPDFLVFDIDLTERNRRHCLFMRALGLAGQGDQAGAVTAARELLAAVPDHPVCLLLPGLGID